MTDPIIEPIEEEDDFEVPDESEELNNRKWTDLDERYNKTEEQIQNLRERIIRLDQQVQNKLVKLGRIEHRLKIENKRRAKKEREKLAGKGKKNG